MPKFYFKRQSTISVPQYRTHITVVMAPKLYYISASAPARSVLMTADALGLELDLKFIDTYKGENLAPEYIKVTCFISCLSTSSFCKLYTNNNIYQYVAVNRKQTRPKILNWIYKGAIGITVIT